MILPSVRAGFIDGFRSPEYCIIHMKRVSCWLAMLICCALSAQRLTAADAVLARVNGEAIYARQMMANMPHDQFAANMVYLKNSKLNRLIRAATIRQFLARRHISVPEQAVAARLAELQKNPPLTVCRCCRYQSLQQFLDLKAYTLAELRAELRNTEGLDRYLRAQWLLAYPTRAARLALLRQERARICRSYVKLWHIFFNTFQQPGYGSDPDRIEKEKLAQANAAWQRLQAGESFTAVAVAVSDDMVTRGTGGALGCLARDTYGNAVQSLLLQLKPGRYSRPVQSIWGYHLIKWAPMTDDDILSVCRQEYMDAQRQTTLRTLTQQAVIVRAKE